MSIRSWKSSAPQLPIRCLALLVSLVLAATACAAPAPTQQQALRIGGIFSLTGANSTVGATYYNVTQMAVDEVNASGGINGRKLEVSYEDDTSDPATGVTAARKLIDQQGMKIIMGAVYSPVALAIANLTQSEQVLLYSPGAVAPALTTPLQKYVFTTYPTAAVTAKVMVNLMSTMHLQKPGIIADTGAFGDQAIAAYNDELTAKGVKVVSQAAIAPDAVDATSQIAQMQRDGVDVILTGSQTISMNAVVKAAYQQKLGVPIIANGGGSSAAIEDLLQGSAPIEYYVASPLACPIAGSCVQDFVAKYKARFPQSDISLQTAQAYPAVLAFVQALKNAKSDSPDDVARAMEDAQPYSNPILPTPIKWTSSNHLGTSDHFMEGFKDGKLYFFGNDIQQNKLGK